MEDLYGNTLWQRSLGIPPEKTDEALPDVWEKGRPLDPSHLTKEAGCGHCEIVTSISIAYGKVEFVHSFPAVRSGNPSYGPIIRPEQRDVLGEVAIDLLRDGSLVHLVPSLISGMAMRAMELHKAHDAEEE